MGTDAGSRNGPREFLLATRDRFPDRLSVEQHALATRVLFDDDPADAVGVEYLRGPHLYRADPRRRRAGGQPARCWRGAR